LHDKAFGAARFIGSVRRGGTTKPTGDLRREVFGMNAMEAIEQIVAVLKSRAPSWPYVRISEEQCAAFDRAIQSNAKFDEACEIVRDAIADEKQLNQEQLNTVFGVLMACKLTVRSYLT
jgi:hypothetical protein